MRAIVSPIIYSTSIHAHDDNKSYYRGYYLKVLAIFDVTKTETNAQSSEYCNSSVVSPREVCSPLTFRTSKNEGKSLLKTECSGDIFKTHSTVNINN